MNHQILFHLSRLKFVNFIVFLFGFFIGIPYKHKLSPVDIGFYGISIPL